jgi:hypothetical protein
VLTLAAKKVLTIKMQQRNCATPSVETGNQTPSPDLPGSTAMMQQCFPAMRIFRN